MEGLKWWNDILYIYALEQWGSGRGRGSFAVEHPHVTTDYDQLSRPVHISQPSSCTLNNVGLIYRGQLKKPFCKWNHSVETRVVRIKGLYIFFRTRENSFPQ